MGAVTFSIDLRLVECLQEHLPLEFFVETGTYQGATLEMVRALFQECYSVELSETAAREAQSRLSQFPNVHVEYGDSPAFLEKLKPTLASESVLYWLDAHWCEGSNTTGKFSQCPLLQELQAIGQLNSGSVIIIDDARLFLAPPLAPHEVSQWPRLQQILAGLNALSSHHEVMVLNDVILYFPARISEQVTCFAHENGTDWLVVSHSARQENALRQTILEIQESNVQLRTSQQSEKSKKENLKIRLKSAKKEIEQLKATLSKKRAWWSIWSREPRKTTLPETSIAAVAKMPVAANGELLIPKPRPTELPQNAYRDIDRLGRNQPIKVAFDIGANEGQTMLQMAEIFADAKIHSFEPFPTAFNHLQEKALPFPQVSTHQMAIGERNGDCTLFLSHASVTNSLLPTASTAADYSPAGWTDAAGTMTVPIATLDTFCANHYIPQIDLLKIDAQGYEMNILQGAERLLATGCIKFIYLDLIFVPLYEGQASFEKVYDFLRNHHYGLIDLYEKNAGVNGTLHWCNALFRIETNAVTDSSPHSQ